MTNLSAAKGFALALATVGALAVALPAIAYDSPSERARRADYAVGTWPRGTKAAVLAQIDALHERNVAESAAAIPLRGLRAPAVCAPTAGKVRTVDPSSTLANALRIALLIGSASSETDNGGTVANAYGYPAASDVSRAVADRRGVCRVTLVRGGTGVGTRRAANLADIAWLAASPARVAPPKRAKGEKYSDAPALAQQIAIVEAGGQTARLYDLSEVDGVYAWTLSATRARLVHDPIAARVRHSLAADAGVKSYWEHGTDEVEIFAAAAKKHVIGEAEIARKARLEADAKRAAREARWERLVLRLADPVLTRAAVRAAGACDAGIREYLTRAGIGEDVQALPLSAIRAAGGDSPFLARAALVAARAARAARRAS